jgi:hypothetical protein
MFVIEMLNYAKRHFVTLLTILGTVVLDIVLNANETITITPVENVLMIAIIALNLTFLFDFTKNIDDANNNMHDLKRLLPPTRIQTYRSVDEVAFEILSLVKDSRTHRVDMVMFDTKIRTADPKKVSKMKDTVSYCTKNKRITLRLAFTPSPDNIVFRVNGVIDSIKDNNNSHFAYQDSKITFASFMVIDSCYVSLRTPFKNGSQTVYCIVKEPNLCELYSSWFNILWDEASHLNQGNINDFVNSQNAIISSEDIAKLSGRINKL